MSELPFVKAIWICQEQPEEWIKAFLRKGTPLYTKKYDIWWTGYNEEPVVWIKDVSVQDLNIMPELLLKWATQDKFPMPEATRNRNGPETIVISSDLSVKEFFQKTVLWNQCPDRIMDAFVQVD